MRKKSIPLPTTKMKLFLKLKKQSITTGEKNICSPVGFLLLRYSVLFTVVSLSLFIALLYLDLYVIGDDALIS